MPYHLPHGHIIMEIAPFEFCFGILKCFVILPQRVINTSYIKWHHPAIIRMIFYDGKSGERIIISFFVKADKTVVVVGIGVIGIFAILPDGIEFRFGLI